MVVTTMIHDRHENVGDHRAIADVKGGEGRVVDCQVSVVEEFPGPPCVRK